MRLRSQLALAFLGLAVIPLTGLTVHSYYSSLRTFRRAVEAEAGIMAEAMQRRMGWVSDDLERRLARLSQLQLPTRASDRGQAETRHLLEKVGAEMGQAAGWVEALEFVPEIAGPPPVDGVPPAPPALPEAATVPAPNRLTIVIRPPAALQPTLEGKAAPAVKAADEWRIEVEAKARELEVVTREAQRLGLEQARTAIAEAFKVAQDERARSQIRQHERTLRLKRSFGTVVRRDGADVGHLQARVRTAELLDSVLPRDEGRGDEVAFAVDSSGEVYSKGPATPALLDALRRMGSVSGSPAGVTLADWIVVSRPDEASGLTLGIARPVGPALQEIRRTAARNLGFGFGMVFLATLGILPLSSRITRNLQKLSEGAERLASGDLEVRVPVNSRDEFGRLADTFNRMAIDLRRHQDQLIDQERMRKELELCRRIQEEMLPRTPLRFPFADVKGVSIPAREVGGDFFNYFDLTKGQAALLVGDVSGKGVAAALLMANLQATLRARLPLEGLVPLAEQLDREIESETPSGAFLTLFMAVLDGAESALDYVNAGHNPPFLLHADGRVEVLEPTGRPLGLYPGGGYQQRRARLLAGDTLFLFTDGLVEAENEAGLPFGTARLESLLREHRPEGSDAILAAVEEALRTHRGRAEAFDDATLVALKLGPLDKAERT